MRRPTTALLVTIAAIPLAAGCAGEPDAARADAAGDEATTSPSASSPVSSSSADPTGGVPTFGSSTGPQKGKASSPRRPLVLTDVTVRGSERFDRIVLQFDGTGTVGWYVNYVREPALEGSGRVVDLGGETYLDIAASSTTAPAPGYYDGPRRLGADGGAADEGALHEVYVGGTFEGHTQVIAGIDGDRAPFRVFTRTEPSRLVIDVAP